MGLLVSKMAVSDAAENVSKLLPSVINKPELTHSQFNFVCEVISRFCDLEQTDEEEFKLFFPDQRYSNFEQDMIVTIIGNRALIDLNPKKIAEYKKKFVGQPLPPIIKKHTPYHNINNKKENGDNYLAVVKGNEPRHEMESINPLEEEKRLLLESIAKRERKEVFKPCLNTCKRKAYSSYEADKK